MIKKYRRARKPTVCKGDCDSEINRGDVYVELTYRTKEGKFYAVKYHGPCWWINLINEYDAKVESYTKPMTTKRKSGRTSFFYRESNPEHAERRRRLLQYLNRDRWKLEGYYEREDKAEIARSYIKMAKRITELDELGLDFRLNQLRELMEKYDRKTITSMAGEDTWKARAGVLRKQGESIRTN